MCGTIDFTLGGYYECDVTVAGYSNPLMNILGNTPPVNGATNGTAGGTSTLLITNFGPTTPEKEFKDIFSRFVLRVRFSAVLSGMICHVKLRGVALHF